MACLVICARSASTLTVVPVSSRYWNTTLCAPRTATWPCSPKRARTSSLTAMKASRKATPRFTGRSRPAVMGRGLDIDRLPAHTADMDRLPDYVATPECLRLGLDEITVLATCAQTAGALFAVEVRMPPGGGPPVMHRHAPGEVYYVLEGEF